MSAVRSISIGIVGLFLSGVLCAGEARFEAGDGHLAISDDDPSGSKLLRLSDPIRSNRRIRTSPAGVVRISLPEGTLFLGADSEAQLDLDRQQITLHRGRLRLLVTKPAKKDWQVLSGQYAIVCPTGSELAVATGNDRPEIHVLRGTVRLQREEKEVGSFAAPGVDIAGVGKAADATKLAAANEWAQSVRATTEPNFANSAGQMTVKDQRSGKPVRLQVSRLHVNVVLRPPLALVQIDQSFFNPDAVQYDGTFAINLPSGGSVSRFATTVATRELMEGELVERRRGEELHPSVVGSHPHLEHAGNNEFQMRVSPIPAKDSMRVLIDYTVPLVALWGEYQFDLPLVCDQKPVSDFTLTGTVHPPLDLQSIASPSYPDLKFLPKPDNSMSFRMSERNVAPPCFSLRCAASKDPKPMVHSYRPPADIDQTFVVTVPAAMNPSEVKPTEPTDVLVLVDTSGHARNLSRARIAARAVVANLRADDRVQLACVDVTYRPLTDDWCRSGSEAAEAGLRRLNEQFALGESDLNATMAKALTAFKTPVKDRRQMIVYVGDGHLKMDVEPFAWPSSPQGNRSGPHFSAIRVGTSNVGREWLLQEVKRTGGRLFDLEEPGDPFRDLFAWSLEGLPSIVRVDQVSIENVESKEIFHEVTWPAGRDLIVSGQGGPSSLKVTVTAHDKKLQSFTVESKSEPGKDSLLLGRLWADQKLQTLLHDPLSKTGEGQTQIVKLCQEWGLLSPYTVFLVPSSQHEYDQLNAPRLIRRRYWSTTTPSGIVWPAATTGTASADQSLSFTERKKLKQVLDAAERALKSDHPELAMQLLSGVRRQAQAAEPKTYNELNQRVRDQLRPGQSLSQMKLWRPLADRKAVDSLMQFSPVLLQIAQGRVNSDFWERHPHAKEMLRTVRECPDEIGLEDFTKFIEQRIGVHVILDRGAIQDEGVDPATAITLKHLDGITLRSLLREALEPHGLTCVWERMVLHITTQAKADEKMFSLVYPVNDLVQQEPLPPPHRLANPYLDIEEASRQRIEFRLKQPVSVDFQKTPLEDAVEEVATKIGIPFRMDRAGLQDEGVATDTEINLQMTDLPAEYILDEFLETLGLTAIIENELLKVTTRAKADEKLFSRLYSLVGIDSPDSAKTAISLGRSHWGHGLISGVYLSGAGAVGGIVNHRSPEAFEVSHADVLAQNSVDLHDSEASDDEILRWLPWHKPGKAAHSMIDLIQQTTAGKWMELNQEGGAIEHFPLSQTLVIRQTESVHREISKTLATLRSQLANPIPWHPRTSNWKKPIEEDYQSLIRIIQSGSARWMEIDQEGGASVPHLASKSLVIRQTAHAHEEISKTLTQLRRSRYMAETLPYRTSLEGIDDNRLFDHVTVTELPLNEGNVRPVSTADEAKWLASRRAPGSLNQRWRSTSKTTSIKREFAIRKTDSRLELALPGRTMRAEKLRAALAYPGVALVEIDAWGHAVRQMTDAALPWLPHRTNEELAELFDVTLVEETPQTVTLRLNFPGIVDTYLQPTYSKSTRSPVRWLVVAGNQPQFELRFDTKSVVAIDAKGQELEHWELIADEAPISIPPLQDGWADLLIIDMSMPDARYTRARGLLREGNYDEAMDQLQEALREKPNQALLNFLLAWCGSFAGPADSANTRLMKSALQRVAMSEATDLVRMITPVNFPSAGTMSVLLSIPEEKRSAEVWGMLAETTRIAEKPQLALTFLNRALKLPSDSASKERGKLLQIELLLATNQLQQAKESLNSLTDLTDGQMIRLADLFARCDGHDVTDELFERVRQRSQPTGVVLAQLLGRQAQHCQQSRKRWELLLEAATLSPPHSVDRQHYLDELIDEADGDDDASTLGELATTQKTPAFQTALRIRQAELLLDRKLAGKIVLELIQQQRVPGDKFSWCLEVLDSAELSEDIVRLVEVRLRSDIPQSQESKQILKEAYLKLGREDDALRADKDPVHAHPVEVPQGIAPGMQHGFVF